MSYVLNFWRQLPLITRRRANLLGKTGGIMTAIGGLLFITFPTLVSIGLKSQMQIKEGNDITKSWKDVPLAITEKIYVWSIENPIQFSNGAKPILKEKGPYFWKQHRWKEIISWSADEESIAYWSSQSFTFDKTRTDGNLNDRITIINVPVYAMAYVINNLVDQLPLSFTIAPIIFGFVNILFTTHGEGFIKELTVGQLIEGYPFSILDTIDILTKPLTWFGIKLPDNGMPGNRFGLLSVKNFTKDGPYEVFTGQGNTKFLKYISYKGKKSLEFYNDPNCNLMNGTDGTTMGSFLSRSATVDIFQGDACKSFHIKYKTDSSVRGISTYRFVFPQSLFASPDKNADNKCFCRTPAHYEQCDGIFDLGPCQMGAPLAFSFPHFLYASNTIRGGVEGLTPLIDKHESFFDIEPTLGAPLRASGKLQVNVVLKPISLIPAFRNVKEAIVPFVWLEEFAEIDDKFELMIKMATIPMAVINYGSLIVAAMGLIVMTSALGYAAIHRNNLIDDKKEITVDEKDKLEDKTQEMNGNINTTKEEEKKQ